MIPVNEPFIGEKELQYVTECLKTGWISSEGKYIKEFEDKWAKYCNRKYGIAVNNGTVALQVAAQALDLPEGSEVIMPTFTIISCAIAVIYNKLKPVLVDSDPETWTMDVTKIEEKITPKTKAIMPVHIYGHPCDMDPILKLAEKYNLKIIEDAAEAHSAEYKMPNSVAAGFSLRNYSGWKKCGSFGDISCFSFYANKIITTGEGGMILTDDEKLEEIARSIRNLCFKKERRFYHTELGNNFRFTNIQAAIGVAQLERIDELINKKRWMGKLYTEKLKDIKGIQLPIEKEWAKNVYWMYGIVLDETDMSQRFTKENENTTDTYPLVAKCPQGREGRVRGVFTGKNTGYDATTFAKKLKDEGIDTRPFFLGMHEQPIFHKMGLFKNEYYPVAERIARQGLYFPSGLTLTEEQIEKVALAVKQVILSYD